MDFVKGGHLDPSRDIRLSGHVSWAGRSSMETVLKVDQMVENSWREVGGQHLIILISVFLIENVSLKRNESF